MPDLRKRIKSDLPIYTIRVLAEARKYHIGDVVSTNIVLSALIVKDIKIINSLSEHPFLDELPKECKEEIALYNPPYEIIKLEKGINYESHQSQRP